MTSEKYFHKMCQINVGGLSNHCRIAIDKYISDNKIDILALQEVGDVAKEEEEEDVFTNMTSVWHHGCHGVGLSITSKFKPELVKELSVSGIDSVFSLCNIANKGILVVSCYCRPEISSTKSLKLLLKNLDDAWSWCLDRKIKSMIVFGDFNARSCNWGDSINNPRGKLLSNYLEEKSHISLHSAATQTFLTSNGGSVIDLTLSYGDVTNILSAPWTENCYSLFTGAPRRGHLPVFTILEIPRGKNKARQVQDYDATDWKSWSKDMETIFSQKIANIEISEQDPEHLFTFFMENLNACNDKFIPKKSVCSHSKPFWCNSLSTLSQELQSAQKEYQFKSDPQNKVILEECKNKFQEALTQEKNRWIHKKLDGLNTKDSIEFWKRYKKQFIKQSEPSISHLYTDQSKKKLTFLDKEKEAILFDTFFTGEHLSQNSFDEDHKKAIALELSDIKNLNWNIESEGNKSELNISSDTAINASFLNGEITLEEVSAAIKDQKVSGKCCDGDKFHPIILKKLSKSPIKFLTLIFNLVLESGNWIWNSSMVSFIRKADKESYLAPGAYRPITIASYIGKIFERVLQKRLLQFCQSEKIIDEAQEGFLPQRNTSRYLYKMSASIAEARRRRMTAMLLFIDFEKAFDSVPIASLIVKLHRHGITGAFLKVIYSFLSSRQMTLKVNDYVGPLRQAREIGLPQGSVLSPLLFIIYVADLLSPKDLPVTLSGDIHSYKYADDGSILVVAKSTTACYTVMQQTCDYLNNWCKKWRLLINCSKNKTESIIMKSKDSQITIVPKLKIGSKEIKYVNKSKVLGVIIDDDLKFDQHAKATLRNCWYTWHHLSSHTTRKKGLNSVTLAILFKTAVLTKLMYAAPVWLNKNLDVFSDLMARALLKINGSQLYIPKSMAEVLVNIPPLSLTLEMVTIKFCLKGLAADNEMRAFIMQLEDTPSHPFYQHTVWVRKCIAVKKGQQCYRSINLCDLTAEELIYSKQAMDLYQCHMWDNQIRNTEITHFIGKDSFELKEDLEIVNTQNISLFPLLHQSYKRSMSSDVLDFVHGRCLLFNAYKKTLGHTLIDDCEDCGLPEDTSCHKLFECQAFDGITRTNLTTHLDHMSHMSSYPLHVIFGNVDIKASFREHVKLILSKTVSSDGYKD